MPRSRFASARSIRSITRGRSSRKRSTSGRGITRQWSTPLRDDVRRRRALREDRDLAEEVAAAETRDLLPVELDDRRAVEDHVEAAAREPLAQDALTLRERLLVELVRDLLELGARQVGEERRLRKPIDERGPGLHRSNPTTERRPDGRRARRSRPRRRESAARGRAARPRTAELRRGRSRARPRGRAAALPRCRPTARP